MIGSEHWDTGLLEQLGPTKDAVVTERRRPWFDPRVTIAAILFVAVIGLAIWYLARPEPLLVHGEAESTRIDIAARVLWSAAEDRGSSRSERRGRCDAASLNPPLFDLFRLDARI